MIENGEACGYQISGIQIFLYLSFNYEYEHVLMYFLWNSKCLQLSIFVLLFNCIYSGNDNCIILRTRIM